MSLAHDHEKTVGYTPERDHDDHATLGELDEVDAKAERRVLRKLDVSGQAQRSSYIADNSHRRSSSRSRRCSTSRPCEWHIDWRV